MDFSVAQPAYMCVPLPGTEWERNVRAQKAAEERKSKGAGGEETATVGELLSY